MVNPDNTKINYIPSDDADSLDEPYVRPVSSSDKPTRDFRKVLTQSNKKEKEGKATTDVGGDVEDKTVASFFDEEAGEKEVGVSVKPSKEDEENASQIAAFSLFDLSKGAQAKEAAGPMQSPTQKVANVESPSDLFKRMASPTKPARKEFKVPVEQKVEVLTQKKVEETPTDKFTTKYHQEQPDLSYVNPLGATPQTVAVLPLTPTAKVERPATLDSDFQLLIEQVIKNMYTVEKMGQTDTVMTLQYPPIFKDAKVTITSYDTARGQFNVTFENLSQSAQQLLDMESNRKTLIAALEQKGYNIHIITTTTVQIADVPTLSEQHSRDQERGQREGERQFGEREEQ